MDLQGEMAESNSMAVGFHTIGSVIDTFNSKRLMRTQNSTTS